MRPTEGERIHPALVGLGMMLIAFNLRPALTSVGPLLTDIRAETGLSAAGAALLTTLPVLCLGLACALGPLVVRRIGADAGVLAAILVVALGNGLRGLGGLGLLYLGVCVAAVGIGLANVLLPGLVKRDFAGQAGIMTGLYTMVLCLGAAAGAGLTVPLADVGGGWPLALAAWSLPALAAALAWLPFARARPVPVRVPPARAALWRDPLAWQVTGFMGLQSALAYIVFGWLPAILQDRGLSALDAGFVASILSIGQMPAALLVPALAARLRDQRGLVVALILLSIASFTALVFGPVEGVMIVGILLGLGVGGLFGLGLTILVLRARDAAGAAGLSTLAQGVGYTVAALGPLGFGLAHDASGGWGWPTLLFSGIAAGSLVCGLGAGRARYVGEPARPSAMPAHS
ncbi:MAG TPA: MFS transporter [Methylobacterium sp.]